MFIIFHPIHGSIFTIFPTIGGSPSPQVGPWLSPPCRPGDLPALGRARHGRHHPEALDRAADGRGWEERHRSSAEQQRSTIRDGPWRFWTNFKVD